MIPTRLLLLAATVLGLVSAGGTAAAGPIYGFRTGVASSSIIGDYNTNLGPGTRNGFAGSMYCRYALGNLLSIQPELGWTSKGDQGDIGVTFVPPSGPVSPVTMSFPYAHRIDYLEIPVLLRLGAPNGSLFEPYLLAGPGMAFRTGSDMSLEYDPVLSPATNSRVRGAVIFEDIGTFDGPTYRDVDWSVIAGGGLAFGRAPFRIIVDSRYALGLAGTFANADASFAHNGSWITTLGIELR